MKVFRILSINPGSTSTKIAITHNKEFIFQKNIKHSHSELNKLKDINSQFKFRKNIIINELKKNNVDILNIDAIIGRGGLLHPIKGGVYKVNEKMISDLKKGVSGQHASNLGGIIALDIAKQINAKAFIADPVIVDELNDIARISGHPEIDRISIFHTLNHKSTARLFAKSQNTTYEKLNLIIAHIGGGISIGAHYKGKVIDVNNALDGDGPFSPERTGSLPVGQLIKLCFSNKYTYSEIKEQITKKGGLTAYLGTNSVEHIEQLVKTGDKKAKLIIDALAYQVAKSIGEMATVLHGDINAILITGGVANSKYITNYITQMVNFLAPVFIYPGENEMQALATNGLLVMRGDIPCNIYT